jgi:hypothetical protein
VYRSFQPFSFRLSALSAFGFATAALLAVGSEAFEKKGAVANRAPEGLNEEGGNSES